METGAAVLDIDAADAIEPVASLALMLSMELMLSMLAMELSLTVLAILAMLAMLEVISGPGPSGRLTDVLVSAVAAVDTEARAEVTLGAKVVAGEDVT